MLVFLCVFLLILIFFSNLKITIVDFVFFNSEKKEHIYKVKLQLYLFNIIKIISFNLKNNKKKEKYIKNYFGKYENKIILKKSKRNIFELEKLFLDLKIGLENVVLTTNIIGLAGTIIPILLRKSSCKKGNFYFNINPIYNSGNNIYLNLDCVIKSKSLAEIFFESDKRNNDMFKNKEMCNTIYKSFKGE